MLQQGTAKMTGRKKSLNGLRGDRDDKERDNVDPNNLIEGGTRNTTVRQV